MIRRGIMPAVAGAGALDGELTHPGRRPVCMRRSMHACFWRR